MPITRSQSKLCPEDGDDQEHTFVALSQPTDRDNVEEPYSLLLTATGDPCGLPHTR